MVAILAQSKAASAAVKRQACTSRGTAMKQTLLAALALCSAAVLAQPAAPTMRLRGTDREARRDLARRQGAQRRDDDARPRRQLHRLARCCRSIRRRSRPGTFVGTAAMTGSDGTLVGARGAGLPREPRAAPARAIRRGTCSRARTMTNATVDDDRAGAKGRTMTLHYKDGEKTIVVPDGIPVVTLKPARPLAAGAGREGDRHGAGPRRPADGAARDRRPQRLRAADVEPQRDQVSRSVVVRLKTGRAGAWSTRSATK